MYLVSTKPWLNSSTVLLEICNSSTASAHKSWTLNFGLIQLSAMRQQNWQIHVLQLLQELVKVACLAPLEISLLMIRCTLHPSIYFKYLAQQSQMLPRMLPPLGRKLSFLHLFHQLYPVQTPSANRWNSPCILKIFAAQIWILLYRNNLLTCELMRKRCKQFRKLLHSVTM